MDQTEEQKKLSRREFVKKGVRASIIIGLGAVAVPFIKEMAMGRMVWQLDPSKCTHCGRCATSCIQSPSAVKCFHAYDMCGYCDLCGGYFRPDTKELSTAAETMLCPTAAIKRKFVEEPFFEYEIDKDLCIGCAICVEGCGAFGNGSLQIQVDHDLCDNCNQCAVAQDCPADAFELVPSSDPYLILGVENKNTKNS